MYGSQRNLPRPFNYTPSPEAREARGARDRRGPDPRAHALALIESFGYQRARQIARNNALITRLREDYWPRVLAAVREQGA